MQGYKVVRPSGTVKGPKGTEAANEGKGKATPWARRKG